jgi:uncharacterized protein YlxW (UPF0749 family)
MGQSQGGEMSDTPRTDDQIGYDGSTMTLIRIEFAKQLERELNEANAIIRQQQLLDEENQRLQDRIKRLEEALAWYESKVSDCNRHGSEGDAARDALAKDYGRKAKEAKL